MTENENNPSAARQAAEGSDLSMTNSTSSASAVTKVITSTPNDMSEVQFNGLAEVEASQTDAKQCLDSQAVRMPVISPTSDILTV